MKIEINQKLAASRDDVARCSSARHSFCLFFAAAGDVIHKLKEKPDQRGQLRDGRTGPFFSLWILGSVDTEEEV